MLSSTFLVLGVVVLALALRSYTHPVAHRLSILCVLLASFLVGYLPAGNWAIGSLAAAVWLLLPWLEILSRVRPLRLPVDRILHQRLPPSREVFPNLNELTAEIEEQRFELVDDVGCDSEAQRQYLRLFYHRDDRLQAAVCLVDQGDLAFYYVSLMTRRNNGEIFTTWNYPFSYSLQFDRKTHICRVKSSESFAQMCAAHGDFLAKRGVDPQEIRALEPKELQALIQNESSAQIRHNVAAGLLAPVHDGGVRYTWRGMLYLWLRFLCDLVRL
jgi:hypothetical protein